ncbi:hypothetical protein P3X46_018224 [Hevea brasiliensis]|uniref:Endonuclease/exonuclease/phosphatase domain-containing protein n=1 Tax=Hevea brasiliensis TaxID=3981 RepID=A0ABQ9LS87_HEVBR|nr:hypothetical protein P3X46_018224 [Hevea brasiliensis]
MSTISWNCRGLGNPRIVQALKDLMSDKKPNFVFLMETKIKQDKVLCVKQALGFKGSFMVDPSGLRGGLALFWKENHMAKLISYSAHHIDVQVCIEGITTWHLTGFYGWDLLRSLKQKSTLPWCVIGDFNDIMFLLRKQGNDIHLRWLMEGFYSALYDCQLHDMGYTGSRYAWDNHQNDSNSVQERLDRVVATSDWGSLFSMAKVYVIYGVSSDHLPLFLSLGIQMSRYV